MTSILNSTEYDSDAIFNELEKFIISQKEEHEEHFNYCPDCNVSMNQSGVGNEYHCPSCGLIKKIIGSSSVDDFSSNVKTFSGKIGSYTSYQQKEIIKTLLFNNNENSSFKIPRDILLKTVEKYHSIQNILIEEEENGITKEKKFVKRGQVKDCVLAKLLYYECMASGIARRQKDLAEFMGLESNGLSKGDNILKKLEYNNLITLPKEQDQTESYISRYFETLSIDKDNYKKFIYDIIQLANKRKIGRSSISCSKVVGSIWFLICYQSTIDDTLNISKERLELACDNIRSNTFTNFSKELEKNLQYFLGLFLKHNIYHGEGIIVKKITVKNGKII